MVNRKKQEKKRSEWALMLLMLFIFSISIYCMLFDNSIFGLISLSNSKNNQPLIGRIENYTKDIRHKDSSSLSWEKAKIGDKIRVGDKVFTGNQSSLSLNLDKGGNLELGENTMITFSSADGQSVANLTFGKITVPVNGNVKIAVNGSIKKFNGNNSKIEVSIDAKQKYQYRVVKGKVDEVKPEPKEEKQVFVPEPLATPAPAKKEEIVVTPKLIPRSGATTYSYVDRLYDLYELVSGKLSRRAERRSLVQLNVKYEWATEGLVREIQGQVAGQASFAEPIINFAGNSGSFIGQKAFLGDNYWRIKTGQMVWAPVQKFTVNPHPLDVNAPQLHPTRSEYFLLSDKVQVTADIEASPELTGFVVEYSRSPMFVPDQTQIRFNDKRKISFNAGEPQDIYIRARGVNAATEITDYSTPMHIHIANPPMPQVPQLAEKNYKIFPDQTLDVEWNKTENTSGYQIELRDARNKVLEVKKLAQNTHQYKIPQVGKYQVQLSSIDRFGRKSGSTMAQVTVEPRIVPPPPQAQAPAVPIAKLAPTPAPAPVRKLSSVSTIEAKPHIDQPYINQKYSSSKIELEGGGEIGVSSQALSASGSTPPDYATMGVKVTHWLDHSGFEGVLNAKVAGLNSASSQTAPISAEARYQYRWSIPWNLFSNINATQFSLVGGYQYYRNSASGNFSPGYDILKGGFALSFPVSKRWDSGGEVLLGRGLDSSNQYEISGNANYYLRSDWSLGVGYRVHLFEAGSNSSAPSSGIPYREGFGEAYSVIRKHY